jgi:hypothetical protein
MLSKSCALVVVVVFIVCSIVDLRSIELINKAAFVSTRSKSQADRLKELTGRKDIYSQPDLAFSFQRKHYEQIRTVTNNLEKKLFVNILPLYAMFNNGIVKPINAYKNERPEIFENLLSIHQNSKSTYTG